MDLPPSRCDHLDPSSDIQISHINYLKGHSVTQHHHIELPEADVSEIWIIVEGSAQVNLYHNKIFSGSHVLSTGHVLLTRPGWGHSLTVLSETLKMVEIKNGPYSPHLTERF